MAKMFYSKDEVLDKLNLTAPQLDKLVQDGKLREFRDGAKVMYKVDEVDNIHPAELPTAEGQAGDSGDVIPLTPTEQPDEGDQSDIGISFEDTGSSIGLAPLDSGTDLGMMPGDSADQISLEDSSQEQGVDKDDTVMTNLAGSGAGLGEDEVDPLAQMQFGDDEMDKVSLDAGSSGSGLLDLSREADDTSLGAELLEEIYPSADEGAVETQLPSAIDQATAPEPEPVAEMEVQAPPVAEAVKIVHIYDKTSGAYGAMLLIPFVVLVYLACVTTAALLGIKPSLLTILSDKIWYAVIGAGVLALLVLGMGITITSKSGQPKQPKAKKAKTKKAKAPKPKKVKKSKKGKKNAEGS